MCEATDANACAEDYGYKLDTGKVNYLDQIKEFETHEELRTFQLLDSRNADGFLASHIDGSISFPFSKVVNPEGNTLKSKEERMALF